MDIFIFRSEQMEELKETTVAENGESVTENTPAEEKKHPFAGIKEQKGLKAKIKFFFDVLEKYPDVRQMIMFTLLSMLCGLCQMGSQFLLQYTLVYIPDLGPAAGKFQWFIFTGETRAEFIGFLVGAVVGQVMTYILNRKKTFRATNNLALSVSLYVIVAVGITLLQTLIPGWITTPCFEAFRNSHNGAEATGFVAFMITLAGTAVSGITALVTSFLGNKFIVMRDWGKKKTTAASEAAASDTPEEK